MGDFSEEDEKGTMDTIFHQKIIIDLIQMIEKMVSCVCTISE